MSYAIMRLISHGVHRMRDVRGRTCCASICEPQHAGRVCSTGNSKNQKVVDGIANDLSNIRTGDVIGRGNDARRRKISLNKSSIVGELMADARVAFRIPSLELIGERCTRTGPISIDLVVNR